MVNQVRVVVDGDQELVASLSQLERDLTRVAPPEAAQIIGTEAKRRAPKRTGRLARSWSTTVDGGVRTMTFGAPYSGPINWGVGPRRGRKGPHNIKATKFFSGAVKDTYDAWLQAYENDIQDKCNDVKGA